jgi:hypothetical protein
MTEVQAGKDDLKALGVSAASQSQLAEMQRHKLIGDQMDGYRLAVATAIAFGRRPRAKADSSRTTKYAAGNLDPEQELKTVVGEIYPDFKATPYRAVEDLAEQGLEILKEQSEGEVIWFGDLVGRLEDANVTGPPKQGADQS